LAGLAIEPDPGMAGVMPVPSLSDLINKNRQNLPSQLQVFQFGQTRVLRVTNEASVN